MALVIGGPLREGVGVHFVALLHQHTTLDKLNSCPQTAMGGQIVSESSTHLRAMPCEESLARSNSRRRMNIPFYHTKPPAQEHYRYRLDQSRLWQEDIRRHVAAQVRSLKARIRHLGQNDVKARLPSLLFLSVPTHSVFSCPTIHSRSTDLYPIGGRPLRRRCRIDSPERFEGAFGGS